MAPEPPVVVSPARARAAAWSVLGCAVIVTAGWAVDRTTSGVVAFVATAVLFAGVAVTVAFAMQVVTPRAWTLRLGEGALRGHSMGLPVDVPLDDVRALRVGRALGDPVLVVVTDRRRRHVLLPVGADVAALRRAVAGVRVREDGTSDTARPTGR